MIHKSVRRFGAVCAALCLLPLAAQAQFNPQYYIDLSSSMLSTLQMNAAMRSQVNILNNIAANEAYQNSQRNKTGATTSVPTIFTPAAANKEPGIAKLASAYPAASRAQVQQTLHELLAGYRQIEQKFDVQRNDVSGAVAAFIVGSYMAYRDVDLPDEHFKPLVEQMRQVLAAEPAFAKATNAQKQELYEQMATLGMLMAATQEGLKQQPNEQLAAAMRKAAKSYLEEFLKVDAAKVSLTAQGLVIR
jgi:hypothetical protein